MDETPTAEPAKPSPVPSWILLGFVLGAIVGWDWSHRSLPPPPPAPAEAPAKPPAPPPPRPKPNLTAIEAVFDSWGQYASWDNDLTEVVLWNPAAKDYTDDYQVMRSGGSYYFRSIAELTRPLRTHGNPPDSPLRYTETEEQRQQWLHDKDAETWRSLAPSRASDSGNP